ncbi:MAG: hypothetical protein K4571_04755 [Deltaproteobacteria bacterium]
MQEILVVAVIAAAIFFLPRLLGKKPAPESQPRSRSITTPLTGRMRLAILVTVLWIAGAAALLKPWEGNKFLFICITLGPVLMIWGGVWVWFGYKKYRR